jgi:hypothetical protein
MASQGNHLDVEFQRAFVPLDLAKFRLLPVFV